MVEEFIKITSIKTENISDYEKSFVFDDYDYMTNEKETPIYQLQCIKNENYAFLRHVGYVNEKIDQKKPSLLVQEFKYYDDELLCKIYSTALTIDELNNIDTNIDIIKFHIYHVGQNKLCGILGVSFFTMDHKKKDNKTTNYDKFPEELLSNKEMEHKLYGMFSYQFYYEEEGKLKKILIKNIKNYPGNKSIIHKGICFLYEETIISKINSICNNISISNII